VLLTDGGAGAFAATNARIYYCPAAEAVVAGTAGAGDAFATTYAAFVADGQTPETALRAASLNAAAVLAHVDTQTGLMQRKELETEIGKSTERLNVMSWPL
jgi:ribokinase